MKDINKKKLIKLILSSNTIYIYLDTLKVQFIGDTLDKCEIKLPFEMIDQVTVICDLLEVEYKVYNKSY